jgi:hypothetical protein
MIDLIEKEIKINCCKKWHHRFKKSKLFSFIVLPHTKSRGFYEMRGLFCGCFGGCAHGQKNSWLSGKDFTI